MDTSNALVQTLFVHYGGPLSVFRLWLTSPLRRYATRPPPTSFKELIVRRLMPAILARSSGVLVSLPGGAKAKVDFEEEIARLLLLHGAYEAAEIATVVTLAAPGSTAIDVGANVGLYTVALASAVGENGRVWAFEPLPQASDRLRANLALNDFHNVDVIDAAAGRSSGVGDLHLADDSAYASMITVKSGRGTGKRLGVSVMPVDDVWLRQHRPTISFCKIDVEGAELSVLEGSEQMLAACRPSLLLEADRGPQLDALSSWLEPRGYCEQPVPRFMPWNHLFVDQTRC
jgi:FkbM family methyltransferase